MSGDGDGIAALLQIFGFSLDEISPVVDELNSYKTIPGITVERYINRIINTIAEEERPAFLKGIVAGLAIRMVDDALYEPDYTRDEAKIDGEIERLKFGR